jgi:hypothetical protein
VPEGGSELGRTGSPLRGRAVLAAILVLGALIVAILLASSTGTSTNGPSGASAGNAPRECLKAWNADVYALNYGVHNSISHGYTDVQIGYMPKDGSAVLSDDPSIGQCAVVFAANQPDPERQAAGQIRRGDPWVPLSEVVGLRELAELQHAAVAGANATVNRYGKLADRSS